MATVVETEVECVKSRTIEMKMKIIEDMRSLKLYN